MVAWMLWFVETVWIFRYTGFFKPLRSLITEMNGYETLKLLTISNLIQSNHKVFSDDHIDWLIFMASTSRVLKWVQFLIDFKNMAGKKRIKVYFTAASTFTNAIKTCVECKLKKFIQRLCNFTFLPFLPPAVSGVISTLFAELKTFLFFQFRYFSFVKCVDWFRKTKGI